MLYFGLLLDLPQITIPSRHKMKYICMMTYFKLFIDNISYILDFLCAPNQQ